ncbi:MAG TPA: GNAT family N-acetyltransferase [Terriglobia bacterium]|nr:GNAT family N-acetyltransferase [Terriglobia bacterium]
MDRAQESNAVFMDAWEAMGKGSAAFEKRRGGLVEIGWMGYSCPFFNMAVTARPPASMAEFEEAVLETSAWAGERRLPWLLAVCHETMGNLLPESGALLNRLGLAPMMPLTGMEAYDLTSPVRGRPEGEWFTEADESIGEKVVRLNEAAYQMKFGEPGSVSLEHTGWWRAPERMATVLAPGGKPESCATVLDLGGLRYVALVATLPAAQRKGYAEAAMRDVLERSLAAGLNRRTYLHATAAGRPVYERMGYTTTAEYTIYMKHE